jgi:hypothetical protein
MFEMQFNMVDLERQARKLDGAIDQVPYALSLALNKAGTNTRQVLVQDTWPRHVTQRNAGFIGRALRTEFATKQNLRVEIYDDLNRGHLKLHAEGGTKIAKRQLAIPPQGSVTRTSSGVRKSQKPAAIIASTPNRALRITARGIFFGEGGRLHLKYGLTMSAAQPADVPFEQAFESTMRDEVRTSFPAAMAKAMSTRR